MSMNVKIKSLISFSLVLLLSIGNLHSAPFHALILPADTGSNRYFNWFNKDFQNNKVMGISTDKAYEEVLKNRKSKTVIVAVIDGGVDINHEDLKDKIWVNEKEIPGNGIDDDHNGFVDDIHGWNFLGNAKGENIKYENLEVTRLFKVLSEKYKDKDPSKLDRIEKSNYKMFRSVQDGYKKELAKAMDNNTMLENFTTVYNFADSLIKAKLGKENFNMDDLKALSSEDSAVIASKDYLTSLLERGFTRSYLNDFKESVETKLKYNLNTSFNARNLIGDNPEDNNENGYGNNDVVANTPEHGTFVSGVIAADRNNTIGIKGIADKVKIMVLRVVPDGDERDKDVANAIKYAVKNGAQVVNMSFGKDFSPQKNLVDDAIKLAEEKGVILVHAAGNESENCDKIDHYPVNKIGQTNKAYTNWISAGASSMDTGLEFAADFSNYGKKTVDLFAPGVRIYSTMPGNKYGTRDGTSFSAPMVTGAVALLLSYFPELTAKQVKEIILKSVTKYSAKVNLPTTEEDDKKTTIKFSKLSTTGGVLNVYNAVKMAEAMEKK
jgi:subtilisin family serine protease